MRTALVLLLCLSLLLPAPAMAAMATGDALAPVAIKANGGPDCHHNARADGTGQTPAPRSDDHHARHPSVDDLTGNTDMPASMACCDGCDCGCLPGVALSTMDHAPATAHASPPASCAATEHALATDESPLRPPIA